MKNLGIIKIFFKENFDTLIFNFAFYIFNLYDASINYARPYQRHN